MKVVFVISSLNAGGAERVIANLANEFSQRGYDVSIVLFRNVIHYSLVPQICVEVIQESHKGSSYIYHASRQLRSKLKAKKPDVVISFLTEINVLSIFASAGQEWKLIVSERNNPYVMPKNKRYRILRKLLYPFADTFVFQTKQARDYFNNTIRRKSTIIHNPVVPTNVEQRENQRNIFSIVSVGRLEPQKNMQLLIDAFAEFHKKYPDSELTIYGEGSERNNLQLLIEKLSLDGVVNLPGNKQNILELIANDNVFVLSSDYEGMSNALMEAMAVGLPCISTDCPIGGSAELISDHENGILVPVGDREKITNAMIELYDNIELRVKIGQKAKEIKQTHSIGCIADKWVDLLR